MELLANILGFVMLLFIVILPIAFIVLLVLMFINGCEGLEGGPEGFGLDPRDKQIRDVQNKYSQLNRRLDELNNQLNNKS